MMAPGALSEIDTNWAPFWAAVAEMAGGAVGVGPEPEELPPPHPHSERPKRRRKFIMAAPVLNEFLRTGGSAGAHPPPPMKAAAMSSRQSARIHMSVMKTAKERRWPEKDERPGTQVAPRPFEGGPDTPQQTNTCRWGFILLFSDCLFQCGTVAHNYLQNSAAIYLGPSGCRLSWRAFTRRGLPVASTARTRRACNSSPVATRLNAPMP